MDHKRRSEALSCCRMKDKGPVINYGEGGGLQNGKIAGPKPFVPTSYNITKISSYRIKTTPKPF